jgi:hypothetical protein
VVTASGSRRLTVPTASGPVDLIPIGSDSLEQALIGSGLSAFGFAWRPATGDWCDPVGARQEHSAGRLGVTTRAPNPFDVAPRRYWIAGRLLAEHDLEPTPALLEAARAALEPNADRLPSGSPARREITRILSAPHPARGLAFLRESGLTRLLVPGLRPEGESIVGSLAPLPALRWAAWLRGCAVQSALVSLRVPHQLGRTISRILRVHPIDETIGATREVGLRKLFQRLSPAEIDGLLAWRRLELEQSSADPSPALQRLEKLTTRIAHSRLQQAQLVRVRSLALDGAAVMKLLDAGPGPHVGRALAHLAAFVEAHPDANDRKSLETELIAWSDRDPPEDEIG